jgi:ParB-like chromosome segregation protein Spo0J
MNPNQKGKRNMEIIHEDEEKIQFKIDPEFQALIPPLSKEEDIGLEVNLKENGCRHPLVVWNGLLLDGHHRWRICKRLGIRYDIVELKECRTRNDAKIWIILNQFDRRNLSAAVRAKLALRLEPMIAARAKENQRLSEGAGGGKGYQKSGNLNTDRELAKRAGLSHDTIHKMRVIEEKAPAEVKEKVLRGETSINREYQKLKAKKAKPEKKPKPRVELVPEGVPPLDGTGRSEVKWLQVVERQLGDYLKDSNSKDQAWLVEELRLRLNDLAPNKRRTMDAIKEELLDFAASLTSKSYAVFINQLEETATRLKQMRAPDPDEEEEDWV